MKSNNYTLLIQKLDLFIRKFYFNKLIRGILYSTAILLVFFLVISIAEYNFYFSTSARKIIFFSFIASSLLALVYLIGVPILKIQKLGNIISHEQAANIIGNHFTNVKDKLLNILQLKSSEVSLEQAALVEASINQKSLELKPVPFTSAIDLNENRQYLKYAIPPLLIFLSLLFFKPNIIKESSQRLIQNDIVFEKPMPFSFEIFEDSLKALQFEDYRLNVKINGKEIPSEIFLYRRTENNNFVRTAPQKLNNTNYAYIFSNLQKDVKFYFEANGFRSKEYILEISEKPMITKFEVKLNYPKYLENKNIILKNTGDISAPFGTSVEWLFEANATEKITIRFSDALIELKKENFNQFNYRKVLIKNDKYIIKTISPTVLKTDSIQFSINVVRDKFPQISVKEQQDSTNLDIFYYIGEISDDYGLRKLTFNYKMENGKNEGKTISQDIHFEKNKISEFTHFWNIKTLNLSAGDKLTYYFQVWDNDGVNGSKSSRSKWMTIKIPSLDEFENKSEQELDELKKDLKKAIVKSQELQKEMKNLKEKLLNKKKMSWEDKNKMKELLSEQKKLQNKVSEMNEKLKENIQKQSEFKEINPEISKKQEQLQKLFNDVLDEEMKKLIEKYEKMIEELNKENTLEQTEEIQVTDEELEKELDRMLEILKKLEFDQKLQETQEKLEKLANKQEELANDENKTTEEKKEEQEKLNEEFNKLKEDLKELEKLDEELGDQVDMEELQEDGEETSEEMEDAIEELSKRQNKKASETQKAAAKKMKEMVKKMAAMAMSLQEESLGEDMQSLRQLLENLVSLSFEEERLLQEFKLTNINTPKYVSLIQDQHKVSEDSELVEDSLFALAKRVIEIESFITDKIFEINRNLDASINQLEARSVRKALVNQQYVMTGYNDLALMLSEVLQQMQQQMAMQMEGNQSCEKPGKGKPKSGKMTSLKKMQQQLSDQIQKMGEQMKPGEGQKKRGEQSLQSKELAKVAAKQQAIREALQKIKEGYKKESGGERSLGDLQKIIDEMKQNESDLVNKILSNELLNRQKNILTRLLEAENAERQRDEKEERKSEVATDISSKKPPALIEYLKKRKLSLDIYKQESPNLKPYYKNISEKYFKNTIK